MLPKTMTPFYTVRGRLTAVGILAFFFLDCGGTAKSEETPDSAHKILLSNPKASRKENAENETTAVSKDELKKLREDFEVNEHGDTFTPRPPFFYRAESAAAKLVALQSAGVPALLDAVDSSLHWSIALRYLWKIKDPRIAPFLNTELKECRGTIKEMWIRTALMRLGEHCDDHYKRFEALLFQSVWNEERDKLMTLGFDDLTHLRMELVQVLGYVGTDDAVSLILKVFEHDKSFVWSVILALEYSKNKKATPTLIDIWDNRDELKVHPDEQYMLPGHMREDILRALGHCGGQDAFELLLKVALKNSDALMRNAAVSAVAFSPLFESEQYVTTLFNAGLFNYDLCYRVCERNPLSHFVHHAACERQRIYTCRKTEFLNSKEGRTLMQSDLSSGSAAQKWRAAKALATGNSAEARRFLDENLNLSEKEIFLQVIALDDNFTVDALNRIAVALPSYNASTQRLLGAEILWLMDHQAGEAGLCAAQTVEWIPTGPLINIIKHTIDSEDGTTAQSAINFLDRLTDRKEASNIARDEELLTLIYELATAKRSGAGDSFRLMILYLLLDKEPNSTRRSFVRDLYIEFIKDDPSLAIPKQLFSLFREEQIAFLSAGLKYAKKGDRTLSKIASALAVIDPNGSKKKVEAAYRATKDPSLNWSLFHIGANVPLVEEYKNAKRLENDIVLQFDWIHHPRMIPVLERTAALQQRTPNESGASYQATIRVLKRARVFAKKNRTAALVEALKDEDSKQAQWAALELGLSRDPHALSALRMLRDEGKREISKTAAVAAENLERSNGGSLCFKATLFEAVTHSSGMSESICNAFHNAPK